MPKIFAVIVGAGSSNRFGASVPKQFFRVRGSVPFSMVVDEFLDCCFIDHVVCVVPCGFDGFCSNLPGGRVSSVIGGCSRQKSVMTALKSVVHLSPDFVLIHDAARPFLDKLLIDRTIKALLDGGEAVVPVIEIPESIRYVNSEKNSSVDRKNYVSVQTPQGFVFRTLFDLHQKYESEEFYDDASMFDVENREVVLIPGSISNRKITYSNDIRNSPVVGFGFDVHAFSSDKNRSLKIFGIKIDSDIGLEGISDADVGIHSLVDAILGALCLGDIGDYFPSSDKEFQNTDSSIFLKFCIKKVKEAGRRVSSIDSVVVCESPKISEYKDKMRSRISEIINIPARKINIKGKTTEKLGFCGRCEGISVMSTVCLI